MAVITARKTPDPHNTPRSASEVFISADAAPADSVEMTVHPGLPHVFLSVRCYDASNNPVVASAGTFDVEARSWASGIWEVPPTSTIDATAVTTIDWALNTEEVKVTPTGLAGVDHWEVRVITNRS